MRDDQWKRLKDWLPGRVGLSGAQDNRLFVDAVLLYRAGIPWRDLPVRFADFQVAHLRHSRWSHSGVWQQVFEALAQRTGNEYAMIGSTVVHKRGVPFTRRRMHWATGFLLTPRQAHGLEGGRRALGSNSGRNRDRRQGL